MFKRIITVTRTINNKRGMEMVQVAILVAIAVAAGIIFKGSGFYETDYKHGSSGASSSSTPSK